MRTARNRAARPLTVATVSLGCVKNIIDTEVFLGNLAQAGVALTADERSADIILVNTCSFIEPAIEESLETLRHLVAEGPRGRRKVVAVGCMVQRFGPEIFRLVPGLAGAVGLDEERLLPELLADIAHGPREYRGTGPSRAPVGRDTARLRITPAHYAYMRVSEGCGASCTFCAIPRIRGRLRSKPIDMLREEAEELAASGTRELILVAQDLTAYGQDLETPATLAGLLAELEAIEGIAWIRLLYLNPAKVTDDLIRRIAGSEKILACIDLPFQHASSRILKAMGRGMSNRSARLLVRNLKKAIPPVVLRGTFLVGFPGETSEDFAALRRFIEEAGFPRGGVFTWSPQPGTRAERLEGRVTRREAERRRSAVGKLLAENARRFNRSRIGSRLTVVVDEERFGELAARSFAEAPDVDPVIRLPAGSATVGSFVEVTIEGERGLDLIARVRAR